MRRMTASRRLWLGIAVAACCLAPPGCADKTNNADAGRAGKSRAGEPGGIEIRSVVRDRAAGRIMAELSTKDGTRELEIERSARAPVPVALTTRLRDESTMRIELSIGVDPESGRAWIRERTAYDTIEMTRWNRDGKVFETCDLNGDRVEFEHADLPVEQIDKAIAKWRRGDLDLSTPEMRALADPFSRLDAIAAEYAASSLVGNPDADVLRTLLNDPDLAGDLSGDPSAPLRADTMAGTLCRYLNTCTMISCRFFVEDLCLFCAAGSIACAIASTFCQLVGCDCCS